MIEKLPFNWRKHVTVDDLMGCWLWGGHVGENGYPRVCVHDGHRWRTPGAHRAIYELLIGPIADGLQLDHLCRVRHCVNPTHLEPVTGHENTLRSNAVSAVNARRVVCIRGHAFDSENTYVRPDGRGRQCRACQRATEARHYQRRSARVVGR